LALEIKKFRLTSHNLARAPTQQGKPILFKPLWLARALLRLREAQYGEKLPIQSADRRPANSQFGYQSENS
jgi:hypothetical protein